MSSLRLERDDTGKTASPPHDAPAPFSPDDYNAIMEVWKMEAWKIARPSAAANDRKAISLQTDTGQRIDIMREVITLHGVTPPRPGHYNDPDGPTLKAATLTAGAMWGGRAHLAGGSRESQLMALAHGEAWGVKIGLDSQPTPEEQQRVSYWAQLLKDYGDFGSNPQTVTPERPAWVATASSPPPAPAPYLM